MAAVVAVDGSYAIRAGSPPPRQRESVRAEKIPALLRTVPRPYQQPPARRPVKLVMEINSTSLRIAKFQMVQTRQPNHQSWLFSWLTNAACQLPPRRRARLLPPPPQFPLRQAPLALFPKPPRPPLRHPPHLPPPPPLPPSPRLLRWLSPRPRPWPGVPRGAQQTSIAQGEREIFQFSRNDS
jgi:hypothetical protein